MIRTTFQADGNNEMNDKENLTATQQKNRKIHALHITWGLAGF
jgi:hypothetical protein